jgi:DNA polymerase I
MAITFKTIVSNDPNTIMIVDALNMAFSFRGKTSYKENYISMIESLSRSYKAGKIIITCDKGSSSYRKNILSQYKQNREALREEQTEQERLLFEAFFREFNLALTILKSSDYSDKLKIFQFDKVEADDIAAYIVNKYKKTHTIWLISSDKDWDLLVDTNVSRFSYVTRKEITKNNWGDHYEYDIDKHISIKCLTGDSGDNIPGVDGIGPKRAISLVASYGDTYDIIASLPIPSKYKYIDALNKFGAENLLRNYKLMDLVSYCEEAIGKENCEEIDKALKEYLV